MLHAVIFKLTMTLVDFIQFLNVQLTQLLRAKIQAWVKFSVHCIFAVECECCSWIVHDWFVIIDWFHIRNLMCLSSLKIIILICAEKFQKVFLVVCLNSTISAVESEQSQSCKKLLSFLQTWTLRSEPSSL